MANGNKLTLGLVVVVGLLATASPGHGGRIYSLAVEYDYGSHSYIDDKGYVSGFALGLIDLVCGEAKMDCRIVLDVSTNCWDSEPGQHATGGKGLLDGWYDACTGWYITVERIHVFQFSHAYLKATTTNFFILPGKGFDTTKDNIMRSKIVFLDGWASDEKCMARETGAILNTPNIVYAKTSTEAIALLNNGWDAIFTTINTLKAEYDDGSIKTSGPAYTCTLAGNGVMARKDNDVIAQWNQGFMKVKNDGRFKKFCETANAEHIAQGTLPCIDS